MKNYFIVYKPFNVLSQFTSQKERKTLKDFFDVTVDVYSVGRLDYNSEGLLILINDKLLNHRLLNPALLHEREYWIQVEGKITVEGIYALQGEIDINIDGNVCWTKKCKATIFNEPSVVAERYPSCKKKYSFELDKAYHN